MPRGRVVLVRPRNDGSFAVTLVMGDRSYGWMLTESAPRLGALLEVDDKSVQSLRGSRGAAIQIIQGGETKVVPEPWARRYVPRPWLVAASRTTRLKLYPHQLEGAGWLAERLAQRKGAILADDQGLGKTLQTAAALLTARCFPAIIVCPSSLKRNWERELQQLRVRLRIEVLDGYRGPIDPAHVIITNYDLLRARERQLSHLGARAIVFDEGQFLKEGAPSPRHRAAVATRLARRIRRVILLSGTPLPNRVQELWRLLHLVDPEEWPNFDAFKERYCYEPDAGELHQGRQLVTKYGRVHHLDELQARMAPAMLRRLKSHVLKDLPDKKRRTVVVELDERSQATYTAAEKDVVKWLRTVGATDRAAGAERGQAFVKLQMLRRIAAIGKLRQAVPSYIETWFKVHKDRGLVIFGFHRDVLEATARLCQAQGLRVARILGKDSDEKRQRHIDAFNAKHADVFLAPIRAAGVGLNLQHGGSDVLFLERMWVPAAMCQAEDRVHRLGQSRQVTVTYLDAKDTIDEHIALVLAQKQRLIDAVVDDEARPAAKQMERETFEAVLNSMGVEDAL